MGLIDIKTNGRETIYANYTESQLLNGTVEEQGIKVLDILKNSISLHQFNRKQTLYLQDYLYGIQDIFEKVKLTRTDINHKSVENWAKAFEDWKATFLLGKPIQYAPLDDVAKNEIAILNKYNIYEHKQYLDLDIYEDLFVAGRGFRFVQGSKVNDEDEAPFDLVNADVLHTEVVYSSSIKHEQLLSFVETDKKYITQEINPNTGKYEEIEKNFEEYTVYTRNTKFVIDDKLGFLQIKSYEPIINNEHTIIEYYFNKRRMSDLEFCKDLFNDINYVENLDLDDIESFVNSIMVFTNAEVDKEAMDGIKEFGAVSIKSTDQQKASVELLQSRLKSLDTQVFYLRKLSALHSILSVPEATSSGSINNAETGKAVLTGQGFTSASIRVEGEEQKFKRCDRQTLKTILKICKNSADSQIKNLKVSDIDIKFSRDLSDNLLNKTQALLNLTTAQIPPEVRNAVIGLFSDPVAVTKLQEKYQQEINELTTEIDKENESNNANGINEQNNNLKDTESMNQQEQ